MPRAGKFTITMPIEKDDECLLIFTDTCIDAWYQNGGDDNEQLSGRRHNITDCFALCGIWNQKRLVSDYSTDSIQIRNDDASTLVEVKDDTINIKSSSEVKVESSEVNINGSSKINVISGEVNLGDESGVRKLIDERIIDLLNNHTHLYNPGPGSGTQTAVPTVPLVLAACSTIKTKAD
jgi:hypothetical protein